MQHNKLGGKKCNILHLQQYDIENNTNYDHLYQSIEKH